ncbi:MAG: hypothetical protein M1836_007511 [Candelina mexicana]|nr:MAG: hypothetical protein M1836_007511 [Candelina mexicana]
MAYQCIHLNGKRLYVTDSDFALNCTYLATLAKEHRSGRLDLKWYIENKERQDHKTRTYLKEVLHLPQGMIYWDKVPGETPTMHGNKAVWVFNLDLDRETYTVKTWLMPHHRPADDRLQDDAGERIAISWDRPRLGDIAIPLKTFEALKDFHWRTLASLPQLGADVLPIQKFQHPSDKPMQVPRISTTTTSVMAALVVCLLTDFASQWYALVFETVLSKRLTLQFIRAYLLLAVWDVDLELNDGGGAVESRSFPTWPTIGLDDEATFWFCGVVVAAVMDMSDENQRAKAISRARSIYEARDQKLEGTRLSRGRALIISPRHIMVINFGRTDQPRSEHHPIFTDFTKIIRQGDHHYSVHGRASVNVSTIEALINVFHQGTHISVQPAEQHNRLLDLPPELRKAVFDLLDRKSFYSVTEALPTLTSEYCYHPVFNGTKRIASVAEETELFEPLRLLKLRFENEATYWNFRRMNSHGTKSRYLLKFLGIDSGLAYYGWLPKA